MNNPRITLKGETLAACNRILSQTPVESYTQLLSILLMRYEQDLIEATNGYLRPTRVPNKAPLLTDKVPNNEPDNVPSLPDKVAPLPDKVPNKAPTLPDKVTNGDKQVSVQPKKTGKQLLMDLED